mmetsp:Transcript_14212/g.35963  ORF Transcript_14212/g.35963 Transcript_14212/m.35963 type:complete len:319 (-) Transcript_14212:773-1729(-)
MQVWCVRPRWRTPSTGVRALAGRGAAWRGAAAAEGDARGAAAAAEAGAVVAGRRGGIRATRTDHATRCEARRGTGSGSVAMAAQVSQEELKKQAAWKAVEYVKSGMKLGLGTGSTAAYAVERIGQLLKDGSLRKIVGVPTSTRTAEQAASLNIPLATLDEVSQLDLAIDGADEVDPKLNVVKGRGGALLREKMVEMASDKFICIVDNTKLVDGLGGSKLAMPVEIVQFCWKYNLQRLQRLPEVAGCKAQLRMGEDGKPYVTDNSNYIVDLYFKRPIADAYAAAKAISALEGVVDHGLFLDMVTTCIIAGTDGVEVKEK